MIKVKINEVLDKQNKSIYWISENTGMSYSAIYNLINNKTKAIHFETLEKIMTALDITDFNKILEIVPDEEE
jgi:putative transcriptional regulator